VPIDRTIGLLTHFLASKTASLATASSSQKSQPSRNLPASQTPASDGYNQPNGYGLYAAPPETAASHNRASSSYVPPDPDPDIPLPPPPSRSQAAYPDPQYSYQTPYTSNTPTFVSPSYTSTDALPATAVAANAYLNNYPPQSPQHNPHYPSNNSTADYSTYHSPGSPTSWRNWAGNMASNLEPGAEYMSSASALMQLGSRSEGPVAQDIHAGDISGSTGQMWPRMIFDSRTGAPQ